MKPYARFAIAVAVFLGFSTSNAGPLVAQGSGPGAGQPAAGAGSGAQPGMGGLAGGSPSGGHPPIEFKVYIDAMAIIDDWRARARNSQIGTPERSGVRINGTRVGAAGADPEVLFACSGSAFLDLTFGVAQPDGTVLYDDGPSQGCDPRQALVLTGNRLACYWYSPPPGKPGASAPHARSEIVLGTVPPVSIVGECITGAAQVVPAMVLPRGRAAPAPLPGCGGSGVTVNGRATGQSANCPR